MARFPTYERQQGLGGGSTASYQSSSAFAAPGRAMQGLGDSVADLGGQLAAQADKIQQSRDDTWFSKARADTALEMQRINNEGQMAATDGAEGYTESIAGTYESVRNRVLKSAPSDRARQMFDEWSQSYRATTVGNAATFQAQSTLAKRDADFSSAMIAHSQTVLADPDQYAAVYKRAMDDLEGARQWMTPEQEQKARATVQRELQLARAKSEIQRNPQAFMDEIGLGQQTVAVAPSKVAPDVKTRGNQAMSFFMGKGYTKEQAAGIVGNLIAESNLRPSGAVGDNGTAFGIAQWRGERLTRLKRFAAANGRSWEDFETQLAFVDMELRNHETSAFQALQNAKTVDEATAAFISYERPAGWTSSNPRNGHNYKGRLSHAAAFAGGDVTITEMGEGAFVDDPRFSALGVNDILSLQQNAEQQLSAMQREVAAQETLALGQVKSAFQLGIATGDPSVTQAAILGSQLPDDDKAQLINSLGENRKTDRMGQDAKARMDAGGAFDPYDSDDRKGVSALFDTVAGGNNVLTDEGTRSALGFIYGRTGILPKSAGNDIRAGLLSKNPKLVGAAGSIAADLAERGPYDLEASENGKELADAATTYRHLTENLGLTNEEAGQRMLDMRDPEKSRQRAALLESEPVKKKLKAIDDGDVAAIFDMGFWKPDGTFTPPGFWSPEVGVNELARSVIVGDYRETYRDALGDAGGDEELAEQLAATRFKRIYGVSEMTLSGKGVVIKNPPEVAYPPDQNGSHDYVREQALQALEEEGVKTSINSNEGITPDQVFLQPYDVTDEDIRTGKPPRYMLYYMQNGQLEQYPLPFYAIPPKAQEVGPTIENLQNLGANRRQEMDRSAIIESGGRGPNPIDEMQAASEEVQILEQMEPEPEYQGKGGGGF